MRMAQHRSQNGEGIITERSSALRYHGPTRNEYLRIARNLVATFNSSASLAELGIPEVHVDQLAREAETLGK
jgi:hypothetical protein